MFDFDKLAKRYELLWNKENHDRPLITLFAPRENIDWSGFPKAPEDVRKRWTDAEFLIRRHRFYMQNTTLYLGEAFPQTWVNLGPDILGAICGCEIEFGEDTSWAVHTFGEGDLAKKDIRFDPENKWFRALCELTQAFVEDSKGEYVVGVTDLHSGLDGITSLRGPENVCLDLFDSAEEVKKANFQICEVFKQVYESQYSAVTKYLPYTTNWMNIFSADREYVTSCDFSCLISKDMYSEFVLPELLQELEFLDSSIYHLDGVAALTHLDTLCSLPALKGIQWVPGSGQKPMREWIDVLQKIQNSGKMIDITVEPEDVKILCEHLDPEGVMMHCTVRSREEGENLLKLMEKTCTARRREKQR